MAFIIKYWRCLLSSFTHHCLDLSKNDHHCWPSMHNPLPAWLIPDACLLTIFFLDSFSLVTEFINILKMHSFLVLGRLFPPITSSHSPVNSSISHFFLVRDGGEEWMGWILSLDSYPSHTAMNSSRIPFSGFFFFFLFTWYFSASGVCLYGRVEAPQASHCLCM